MVATNNKRDFATAPVFTPLPYGLLDAAEVVGFTGHQKEGVMFTPDYCGPLLQTDATCVTGTGAQKLNVPGDSFPTRAGDPFVVYAWLDCPLVGQPEDDDFESLRSRTQAALENNENALVENIFWAGGVPSVSPNLSATTPIVITSGGSTVTLQTAATVITGTYDVVEAIGLLEEAIGNCYRGVPIIHVPRAAGAHLAANHVMDTEDGVHAYTPSGSKIVLGAGYTRTGPGGVAAPAGHAWFYATGAVKAWRGDILWTARDIGEMLGRATNQSVLIAERRYVLGWDCCHFAILVSLGGIITGTPVSAT